MINFKKAFIAGLVGTLAVDITGLALTGGWWDIPSLLSAKLAVPIALGVFLHYTIGFTLAAIYGAVAPSLPGGRWGSALLFVAAETFLGVYLFMFPLVGAGAFGLGLGVAVPFISAIRHLALGLVFAWLYPVQAESRAVSTALA